MMIRLEYYIIFADYDLHKWTNHYAIMLDQQCICQTTRVAFISSHRVELVIWLFIWIEIGPYGSMT